MEQGAPGAAGVRRVGYELGVSRSVRTAGGPGAYRDATRTACYYYHYLIRQMAAYSKKKHK